MRIIRDRSPGAGFRALLASPSPSISMNAEDDAVARILTSL